jgi:hypothetical protein
MARVGKQTRLLGGDPGSNRVHKRMLLRLPKPLHRQGDAQIFAWERRNDTWEHLLHSDYHVVCAMNWGGDALVNVGDKSRCPYKQMQDLLHTIEIIVARSDKDDKVIGVEGGTVRDCMARQRR